MFRLLQAGRNRFFCELGASPKVAIFGSGAYADTQTVHIPQDKADAVNFR